MQENITINSSRCFLVRGGRNLLFLCINAPLFCSPREQAKSRHHLLVEYHQLDGPYLALLNHLSHRQAPEPELIEDVHVLVEEAAEVDALEEEEEVVLIEEVGLIEATEEEDDEGEHHLPPYQRTCFY
jgi:hypothetical protein